MIYSRKPLYISLLLSMLTLSACTHSQNSVDRNARHAATQIAQLHFDPNTRPLTADNIRSTAEFLRQFYDQGKQDRAAGLNMAQAQQRVNSFGGKVTGEESGVDDLLDSPVAGPFDASAQKSVFLTHEYSAEQPEKQSRILLDSAIKTYWDGYYGRP